jgi:hypothetical protein
MTPETAQLVLALITVVALTAWVAGVQFLVNAARQPAPPEGMHEPELPGDWVHTSVEVAGDAAELSAKATALLVGESAGVGQVRIVERSDQRIAFETAGEANPVCPGLRRGELRFSASGGRTRIDAFLQVDRMSWMLWLGGLFSALGLIAIIAGCWVIYTFVTTSPDLAVRWQTLQMMQVVHFLWPPFLFGVLFRRLSRFSQNRFETLLTNLPYHSVPR